MICGYLSLHEKIMRFLLKLDFECICTSKSVVMTPKQFSYSFERVSFILNTKLKFWRL